MIGATNIFASSTKQATLIIVLVEVFSRIQKNGRLLKNNTV